MTEIYLDNNATTKPLPEVIVAMHAALDDQYGNPSSVHWAGGRSRGLISSARAQVSSLLCAPSEGLTFTSGATESNNWALFSSLKTKPKCSKIITTVVEHSSVLSTARYLEHSGYEVIYLKVDNHGCVDLGSLAAFLDGTTALVSVQWVNNETGVVQPIQRISELCRNAGALLHVDAAQALGKMPISLTDIPVDLVSITGHKLHAPQGVGALYCKEGIHLQPFLHGGDQENGLRPGTENVAGIVGFGEACKLRRASLNESIKYLKNLRNRFEKLIINEIENTCVNGGGTERICNTSNILFLNIDGQALVARLDQAGIFCSQSSACTNQRPEPSYVLRAMGLTEEEAYSSVRFSFSVENTFDEIEVAVSKIARLCKQLREF